MKAEGRVLTIERTKRRTSKMETWMKPGLFAHSTVSNSSSKSDNAVKERDTATVMWEEILSIVVKRRGKGNSRRMKVGRGNVQGW